MQRVTLSIKTWVFYANPPTKQLRLNIDYRFEPGALVVYKHSAECLGGYKAEVARRLRRIVYLQKKIVSCVDRKITRIISLFECPNVFVADNLHPEPIEVLNLLLQAHVYKLIAEGKLNIRRLAYTLVTASCRLVECFWWKILENLFGRHALRSMTVRVVKSSVEEAYAALTPMSKGQYSIRRSRCYLGCLGEARYLLEVPREIEVVEALREFSKATQVAAKRLREELEIKALTPEQGKGYLVKLGVGSWPLSSVIAVAALSEVIGPGIASTVFEAYRRCGGPRLWPPRSIDVILGSRGEVYEAAWVYVNAATLD